MDVLSKFLRYVKIDTQSKDGMSYVPSTEKQKNLGKLLVSELIEMGVKDAYLSEHGYVYATIPSNIDQIVPTVGFIAHMDTSPDYSGEGVNPRVIYNYDGKDITLSSTVITKVSDFPELIDLKGKTLVVTDGNTLLGSDDKAGIAEIMSFAHYLLENPEVKHGTIKIGFTPDEEVGAGADYFDVEHFHADFAYTVDGGEVNGIEYENFNAAQADIIVHGFSIHPGSAKDKMKNSISIAMEFDRLLPASVRPEYTSGYEGFNHLTDFHGDIEKTELTYIIRNHDDTKFKQQKALFMQANEFINAKYGEHTLECKISETYRNMKEAFIDKMYIIDIAKKAIEKVGLNPVSLPIRGGTDGARLTYMGLPCPNIGTGGRNCHGRYELCVVEEMMQSVEIMKYIVQETMQIEKE